MPARTKEELMKRQDDLKTIMKENHLNLTLNIIMIHTSKSELKLRPTYDELVGMIESQGDPNRSSITEVIDRRATMFRNSQFGSQFDNLDFLGLKKKQEEDRARDNLRQAQ